MKFPGVGFLKIKSFKKVSFGKGLLPYDHLGCAHPRIDFDIYQIISVGMRVA